MILFSTKLRINNREESIFFKQEHHLVMKCKIAFISILVVLTFFGCDSNPSDSMSNNPQVDPSGKLECELEGYPCSLSDVPYEIYQATVDALNEATEVRNNGNMEDVREYFESLPNIEQVVGSNDALRFRLNGGAPAWFLDVSENIDTNSDIRSNRIRRHTSPENFVVGEDQNGDDKVNNRDFKRALILAPYLWEFEPYDESPILAERMNLIEEYEDYVVYKANTDSLDQNISIEDYTSWNSYDFIYISTHGSYNCWRLRNVSSGICGVVISSGLRVSSIIEERERPARTGAYLGSVYSNTQKQSNLYLELMLTQDFFKTIYRQGLDNKIVVFSACKTGDSGASELTDAIGGENFVMFGWTETVLSSGAAAASKQFIIELENGLTAKDALTNVEKAGLSPFNYTDKKGNNVTTEFAHYISSGGDQRIVELPTLLHDGNRVTDGSDLSDIVEGTAGDGEPDILNLMTQLSGVEEGKEQDFHIRYLLDDREAAEGYGLIESERVDEYTVKAEHRVNLGFDAPEEPEIEVVVNLPEGGESRYAADVSLVATCNWQLSVSGGGISGSYESDLGIVQLDVLPTIILNQRDNSDARFTGIAIQLSNPLPEAVPASLTLGLTGDENSSDDGYLTLGFKDVTFRSGNGEACCGPNPNQNLPSPLDFTLSVNEPNEITGYVNGKVWADPEPGESLIRTASVDLNFTIVNDGTCVINDPANP